MLPSGALSVFPHCRSSVCSRRSDICFPTAAAVLAPAGATQEPPPAVFFTAPAVNAPAGAPPVFPHYRSSARSCRSSLHLSTAAAVPAPQEFSLYFYCRSSDCSRRSATCISSLPQQCLLPQERYLYFLTAAAVLAPAGAFPPGPSPPRHPPLSPPTTALPLSPSQQPHATIGIPPQLFSSLPQQCLLQQEPSLYFPTAAVVPAPTGFFSIFPHCPSSDCSRRSTIYLPTTAVVSAPAGALSIFSHCRSSACPRRSFPYVSPLPQQCLLQQERYLYFLTAAVVTAPP